MLLKIAVFHFITYLFDLYCKFNLNNLIKFNSNRGNKFLKTQAKIFSIVKTKKVNND